MTELNAEHVRRAIVEHTFTSLYPPLASGRLGAFFFSKCDEGVRRRYAVLARRRRRDVSEAARRCRRDDFSTFDHFSECAYRNGVGFTFQFAHTANVAIHVRHAGEPGNAAIGSLGAC